MSVMEFLDWVNGGGETHPKCGLESQTEYKGNRAEHSSLMRKESWSNLPPLEYELAIK